MALIRQGTWFLIVGGIQVLLDWAVFVALSALGIGVVPANLVARVAGASLGFWLNGRLTFAEGGEARLGGRRLGKFLVAWIALTALSTLLLTVVAGAFSLAWAWLAKPVVEAGMAVLSFFIARHWVYR
ncbi:MAG TPA: GtrA family protein [Xanthomonadaceae bacterium]|nr:GtrA family protein [Xanthomonadaceae bacterium]